MYKVLYGSGNKPLPEVILGSFESMEDADRFIWNKIEICGHSPPFIRIYYSKDLSSIVYDLDSLNICYYLESSDIGDMVSKNGILP